jgi:hypothetical protein
MSGQRFTNAFRDALWSTHSKKCFYCRRELALLDMEIDHVLHESLLNSPRQLAATKQRLGLDPNFDIVGFENLAPACRECNSKKGALSIADGKISIDLARLAKKLPALEAELNKQEQERDLETTVRFIIRSLDSGKYTEEQLKSGIETFMRFRGGISGSSPLAPPPSPEFRKYGNLPEPHQIIWTSHALKSMKNSGINAAKIVAGIVSSATSTQLGPRSCTASKIHILSAFQQTIALSSLCGMTEFSF